MQRAEARMVEANVRRRGMGSPEPGPTPRRQSAASALDGRRPPRQANSSLITLPELAIFIGRPFFAVKVVSRETPRDLSTLAITSCDV